MYQEVVVFHACISWIRCHGGDKRDANAIGVMVGLRSSSRFTDHVGSTKFWYKEKVALCRADLSFFAGFHSQKFHRDIPGQLAIGKKVDLFRTQFNEDLQAWIRS
jgi:hypothetical protein